MSEIKPKVRIYTDGACSGNPGPGGWGAYVILAEGVEQIYGSELHTTNNRMELLGAIEALSWLTRPHTVELYTDSIYLQQGITVWVKHWQQSGWKRKSDKTAVKNVDLWQKLVDLANIHQINWHWVKGHSDNAGNIIADRLALQGVKQAQAALSKK